MTSEELLFVVTTFSIAFALDQTCKAVFLLAGANRNITLAFQLFIFLFFLIVVVTNKVCKGVKRSVQAKFVDDDDTAEKERLVK